MLFQTHWHPPQEVLSLSGEEPEEGKGRALVQTSDGRRGRGGGMYVVRGVGRSEEMRKKTEDMLREFYLAAKGSQVAGSGNLPSVFYLMPVQCKVREQEAAKGGIRVRR